MLYALGEEHRIVGISGFTVRPPRARKEKPKVSAFTSAKIDAILALKPDLVIGFSDIQADIARDLVRAGVEVWIANHRSVEGILDYIAPARRAGRRSGCGRTRTSRTRARRIIAEVERAAAALPRRPRVYFEEWDEPLITGIRWVAELIRIAGGDDVFPERAAMPLARDRILADRERGRAARARHRASARGAARSSGPSASPRGRAGRRCRRCAMASCTRSSRRSSCSRGRRRCSTGSMRCTRSFAAVGAAVTRISSPTKSWLNFSVYGAVALFGRDRDREV